MSLILQKFKEIKESLSSIETKEELLNVLERVKALVNREYPSKSIYANKMKEIEDNLLFYLIKTNVKKIESVLELIIDDLELKHDIIPIDITLHPETQKFIEDKFKKKVVKKKIFIVHGHNEVMKQSVARFIENIGLEAIILSEQANKGKTTLEKFHINANVDMAIILLSGDDKGYSVKEGARKVKHRARQNVIFELGYFIGKFNREKVIALVENASNFETPSDLHGVVYTPFDGPDGAWKASVLKELKANGFDIDVNKVF